MAFSFAMMNAAAAQQSVSAAWSAAFVDSVGVNTHFIFADTYYAIHFADVKARLLELGIHHIRDGTGPQDPPARGDPAPMFRSLGQSGISTTFIFDPNVARGFVQDFPAHVAPGFEAYELPNEYNLNGGPDWADKLRAWMSQFHDWVHAKPATATIPILGPSLVAGSPDPFAALGEQSRSFDYGNVHVYFDFRNPGTSGWGDLAPPPCQAFNYGSIGYIACLTSQVSGGRKLMVTETGWDSDPAEPGGVPPAVQAKYIARVLLLEFNRGTQRTFIYQFVDSGRDNGRHHGLLSETGTPKPSFTELKAMLALLADHGGTGAAGSLPLTLTGDLRHVEKTLLRRTDGTYRLILWIEQPGFDHEATGRPTPAMPPQQISIAVPGYSVRGVLQFQDDGRTRTEPASGTINLTDNLTIVDIAPNR